MNRALSIIALILLSMALTLLADSTPPASRSSTRPATKPATHPAPIFPPTLKTTESPYYIIHTDLDLDATREAYVRMTRMFEEYQRRTAGFSGEIRGKFPFYLFKDEKDYAAAGGLKDSEGVFIVDSGGSRLMAIAGEKTTPYTWHVVQHEGFHQFAAAVIRGDLPPWLNEGLAEYFGEALFTGDSFVSGVIPPRRLLRIQNAIAEKKFKPFREMFLLSQDDWNDEMATANYDQAWAMVHFLAQGEDGKYQKAFVAFMRAISTGKPYLDAWFEVFGRDVDAFQKRFEKWWSELPPNPTAVLYERATLLILTSFLARANAQGQKFDSADAFLLAAADGSLKRAPEEYLPQSLARTAGQQGSKLTDLTLLQKGPLPQMSCIASDGSKMTVSYTLNGTHVRAMTVDVKPATRPATQPH